MDPRTKKRIEPVEDIDIELEDEIEVPMEEYENLFFALSDDEVEEACELAQFYAEYWKNL